MARLSKSQASRPSRKALTISHRVRLVAELREDPQLAAEYLNAAAEDSDPRVYLAALRTVAEAKGIASVARKAGVPRESVYRALSTNGNPRFSTLHAILRAAGLKFTVDRFPQPAAPKEKASA